MRKGKDLIGKMIIAYDSGEKIESIKAPIFDRDENRLLGFVTRAAGWFSSAKILPLYLVKAIGIDAIIVPSRDAISPSIDRPNIHKVLQNERILDGTRIVTTDGRDLGKLIDFYFDEQTGIVEGYEVSGGGFADADSGRSFVPATHTLKIGRDVVFVPAETVGLMEERFGGWKAAIQTTAQNAGVKLQDTDQSAGDRLQAAGRAAHARVTDALVDRSAQTALEIGKAAQHTVNTPSAAQLVRSGETTAPKVVRTRLKTTTTAREQIQSDATYWEQVRATAADIPGRSAHALEEKRIRGALGRPTIRVILDRDGEVILNVGELISHSAIDKARSAGVLHILLDSVYTEPPRLAIDRFVSG